MLKQRELNASDTMGCGGKTYSKPSGHTEGDTRPGRKKKENKNTDIISQTSWVMTGKLLLSPRSSSR